MFGKLGILNAFLTYDIFNLQWAYGDVNLSKFEEHLYSLNLISTWDLLCVISLPLKNSSFSGKTGCV